MDHLLTANQLAHHLRRESWREGNDDTEGSLASEDDSEDGTENEGDDGVGAWPRELHSLPRSAEERRERYAISLIVLAKLRKEGCFWHTT